MLKKKLIAQLIMTVVMALSLMAPAMAVDAPKQSSDPLNDLQNREYQEG